MAIQFFIWRVGAVLQGIRATAGGEKWHPGLSMRTLTSFHYLEVSRCLGNPWLLLSASVSLCAFLCWRDFTPRCTGTLVLGWDSPKGVAALAPALPDRACQDTLGARHFQRALCFPASASFSAWKDLSPQAATGSLRALFPGPREIPLRGAGKPPGAFLSGSSQGADGSNMRLSSRAPSFCLERRQQRR